MTPEVRSRVFEPFFTTKNTDHNTGLGLAVCNEIIKLHKGSISVQGEPGKGSSFFVKLPLGENRS
jgi:signal transduction histidine kinase